MPVKVLASLSGGGQRVVLNRKKCELRVTDKKLLYFSFLRKVKSMCKKRKLGSVWCQRLNAMISVTGKHVYVDPVSLTSNEDNTGALVE